MRYLEDINKFIGLLLQSERFHVLTIMGAPGWAKTATTRKALTDLGIPYQLLGAYSTPLALYNKMADDPHQILVLDDCAGIFHNAQALSLLNAATWPSADAAGQRRVTWTSTSEKSKAESFDFAGKLIVLTNFMPETPQAKAFVNRALNYRVEIDADLVAELLLEAAQSERHFACTKTASAVARFLGHQARYHDPGKISLRTLELGYEFAMVAPSEWQDLLLKALPKPGFTDQEQLVRNLVDSTLKSEQQAAEFSRLTGKSRRTFFYMRGRLGLGAPPHNVATVRTSGKASRRSGSIPAVGRFVKAHEISPAKVGN